MSPSAYRWISLSSLLAFAMTLYVGGYAPYLVTARSVQVRTYVVFPAIAIALVGLFVLAQAKEGVGFYSGLAGMEGARGFLRRLWIGALAAGSVLACAAVIAAGSIVVPSVATLVLASRPFAHAYRVVDVRGSTPSRRELLLLPAQGHGDAAWLRLRWIRAGRIEPGDVVCVMGREWALGAVASQVTRELEACRVQVASSAAR